MGTAEASRANYQWLRWAMRCAERGRDYGSSGSQWPGDIVKFDQTWSLLAWAARCRDAGEMLAIPREFHECRISPFLLDAGKLST